MRKPRCFVIGILFGFVFGLYFNHVFLDIHTLKVGCENKSAVNFHRISDQAVEISRDDTNLMLVGVITARKYLHNRVKAINMTWANRIPGKIIFFVGEGEPYKGDLNVVQLRGVSENTYPPQNKSFAMLEYFGRHYADKFKWFVRADDDSFLKPQALGRFLASIDNTRRLYIGQPGYGKPHEIGKLGIEGAFCMGGPAVILSRATLQGLMPRLTECKSRVYTSHEDTELGRCISKLLDISCTEAYEMRRLFYQNYRELDKTNSSFKSDLGRPERNALTLHPVKEAQYFFRLENFLNIDKLQKLESKNLRLQSEIIEMQQRLRETPMRENIVQLLQRDVRDISALNRSSTKKTNLDGLDPLPTSSDHIYPSSYWEPVRITTIYSPKLVSSKMHFPTRHRGRLLIEERMFRAVEENRRVLEGSLTGQGSVPRYHYQRLSVDGGVQGVVYVNYTKKPKPRPIRQFVFSQPFSATEFREATPEEFSQHSDIVLVMALAKRPDMFQSFLKMYSRVTLEYKGKIHLHLVIFKDPEKDYEKLTVMTSQFLKTHPGLLSVTYSNEEFSRGKGMMQAIQTVNGDALLLVMDVDMTMTSRFLERVSTYTIKGKQAFFPIYFTHYNPSTLCRSEKDCQVPISSRSEDVGFWRSFSYGIAAIYKSDLIRCGGFRTNITGWGLEDTELFERCLLVNLNIVRAADPGIVHIYHERHCSPELPQGQLDSCQNSGASMQGSVKNLANILMGQGYLVENYKVRRS